MSLRSDAKTRSWAHSQAMSLYLATAGALLLALLSQVKFYIPGNPVPVTMQVLAVILLGGLLGPRLAVAAVAEYLLFGLCGLPVFAGSTFGLGVLLGATGGYFIGFLAAAVITGAIYARFTNRHYGQRVVGMVLAGLAGVTVIYLGGWLWLACWGHMSLEKAFVLGVAPFAIMDILKVSVAATALALRRKGAA